MEADSETRGRMKDFISLTVVKTLNIFVCILTLFACCNLRTTETGIYTELNVVLLSYCHQQLIIL